MFSVEDKKWMEHAVTLANTAKEQGEVPVGAVLVLNNEIIGEGYNHPIHACDPTAHAEINALRHGAATRRNYRLPQSILYVTLEPCIMCLGAAVHARVKRLVYGAADPRVGAVSQLAQLYDKNKLNHHIETAGGLLAVECGTVLSDFFREKRLIQSAVSVS
jgi:tRNA(adenine34) deaminase